MQHQQYMPLLRRPPADQSPTFEIGIDISPGGLTPRNHIRPQKEAAERKPPQGITQLGFHRVESLLMNRDIEDSFTLVVMKEFHASRSEMNTVPARHHASSRRMPKTPFIRIRIILLATERKVGRPPAFIRYLGIQRPAPIHIHMHGRAEHIYPNPNI